MQPCLLDPRPYFTDLPDPRRETRNKLHSLQDILMIVLCAVLSGVEDWVGMEAFAEEKIAWLQGGLGLSWYCPKKVFRWLRAYGGHLVRQDGGGSAIPYATV